MNNAKATQDFPCKVDEWKRRGFKERPAHILSVWWRELHPSGGLRQVQEAPCTGFVTPSKNYIEIFWHQVGFSESLTAAGKGLKSERLMPSELESISELNFHVPKKWLSKGKGDDEQYPRQPVQRTGLDFIYSSEMTGIPYNMA